MFDDAEVAALGPAAAGVDPEALRYRGALTRVALMAGALERMSEMTVAYTGERRQFGRPVSRFQAVQQHLVTGAQQSALVSMAAHVAGREAERGAWPTSRSRRPSCSPTRPRASPPGPPTRPTVPWG